MKSAPGEVCILAGGLSTRMGRDKSSLRLRGKTLLEHVQRLARTVDLPVRVIRRELLPRCGPLAAPIPRCKRPMRIFFGPGVRHAVRLRRIYSRLGEAA